jgi:hypothetical protein
METGPRLFCVTAVALILMGCGTVFQGLTQKVRLTTTPDGATASVGGATTTSPGDVTVRRAEWVVARATKPGYGEACRIVPGRHNPWFALLNSVPAGLGWVVDRPTQGNRRFPDEIHLDLPATTATPLPPDMEILRRWTREHTDMCEVRTPGTAAEQESLAVWGASFDVALVEVSRPAQREARYGPAESVRVGEGYRDPLIEIALRPRSRAIDLRVSNLTAHTMRIVWDEAAFTDFDGSSRRIVHAGTRYSDLNTSQIPTTIAPHATVQDRVVPTDRISTAGSGFVNAGLVPYLVRPCSMPESEFVSLVRGYEGKHFRLLLPITINGIVNEYNSTFEVRAVKLRRARGCVWEQFVQQDGEIQVEPWGD